MAKDNENKLALVKEEDLSLAGANVFNAKQLQMLMKETPTKYAKERPAKGGGTWTTVTGGYIKKCLNLMFGWDWDFEVIKDTERYDQVQVLGRLTCRTNGTTIVKMQWGRKDIAYRKGTKTPVDFGNDLKAATTDALKKCASELGIAADIYNAEEFKAVEIEQARQEAISEHEETSSTLHTTSTTSNSREDDDEWNFNL